MFAAQISNFLAGCFCLSLGYRVWPQLRGPAGERFAGRRGLFFRVGGFFLIGLSLVSVAYAGIGWGASGADAWAVWFFPWAAAIAFALAVGWLNGPQAHRKPLLWVALAGLGAGVLAMAQSVQFYLATIGSGGADLVLLTSFCTAVWGLLAVVLYLCLRAVPDGYRAYRPWLAFLIVCPGVVGVVWAFFIFWGLSASFRASLPGRPGERSPSYGRWTGQAFCFCNLLGAYSGTPGIVGVVAFLAALVFLVWTLLVFRKLSLRVRQYPAAEDPTAGLKRG